MSATLRLIESIARKYPNDDGTQASDYRIAKMLGISREAVSQYRRTGNQFAVTTACRAAALLDLDPMAVIAEVEKDRSKNDLDRDFWNGQLRRLGVAAAVGVCIMHTAFIAGEAHAASVSAQFSERAKYTFYVFAGWIRSRAKALKWLSTLSISGAFA